MKTKIKWGIGGFLIATLIFNFGAVSGLFIQDFNMPSGMPRYGTEMGISYDDVSTSNPAKADETIRKMSDYDWNIKLTGTNKQRYINILYNLEGGISCEYCCGATSIIFEDGTPACGCAHSYAMRGLTKYLIVNEGDSFTDVEIMEEVAKWKALFFPNQIMNKADILKSMNVEPTFLNVASNKYRGVEKSFSSSGGMVGGC